MDYKEDIAKIGNEKHLFDYWKMHQKLLFCEDGILDKDSYEKCDTKVLFVLKDVNNVEVNIVNDDVKSSDGINIDMRKELSRVFDKEEKGMWTTLQEWLSALLNIDNSSKEYFAFINIKKDEGLGSVANSTLLQYAIRDKELLKKQIEIISPDIIIACGREVFNALAIVFGEDKIPEDSKISFTDKMKEYGRYFDISKYIQKKEPVYIIEYRHPNRCYAQGSNEDHLRNMSLIRDFFIK